MTKFSPFFAVIVLLTIVSCEPSTDPKKPKPPEQADLAYKSSAPDPNDLLKTLQGVWQSEQDPGYTLEIEDTQVRHLNNGQMTHQSMIEVDGACESPVCRPDGVDTSDGWCFTEMTIEKGKYKAQCNFVTLCDPTRLQYRSLDGTGAGLSFKKIQ